MSISDVYLVNWRTDFNTLNPVAGCPRLMAIASETVATPRYSLRGDRRKHNHIAYQYSLSGSGVIAVRGRRYEVPAGNGFLCRVDDPAVHYYYPATATAPWTFIFVEFTGGHAADFVAGLNDGYGYVHELPADRGIIKMLKDYRDGPHDVDITASAGAGLVNELMLSVLRQAESSSGEIHRSALIERARREMSRERNAPLTVTDLAALLQVSREHLTREFKAHTGITPYQAILRHRIRIACRALLETDESVKQIAYSLDFSSNTQFSHTFKRVTGMTPRQYRKRGLSQLP
jgi:AraC-like DNA-binding protein